MKQSISVIGLGYVGLPLALTFSQNGYRVVGIDVDIQKIRLIMSGKSYLTDINDNTIKSEADSGRFTATDDYSAIAETDVIIICVPTPLDEQHAPDLSYLVNAGTMIKQHIRSGHLIILESSTYPGTTKEVLKPLFDQEGLEAGKDYYLGYSPERIDPGNRQYSFKEIPKIISGVTEACAQKIYELYKTIFDHVVPVSSSEVAELAKLLENSYRFVNISFINEFAILCDQLKIDVWEVIEAAGTKPYGFSKFFPGPGVGGHCIPVDPLYLQWKAKKIGSGSVFIEASAAVNNRMPAYIVSQVKAHLPASLSKDARILVVGAAYKNDIHDVRESASLALMKLLSQEGFRLNYHDPYVTQITLDGFKYRSVDLTEEYLQNTDCVIIATGHSQLPIESIINHATFVFDTRNLTKGLSGKAKIIRLGGGS